MKKRYIFAASAITAAILFAGCGSKENYACDSRESKKALEAAVEESIITDMIRSRGFTFANKKVFDETDNEKMKQIYAEIKAEYSKLSIDIDSIKTKTESDTLKQSECEAKLMINDLQPRVIGYTVKAISKEKVEVNITK